MTDEDEVVTSCISNGGGCSIFERSTSHQVHRILIGKCPVIRHHSFTQQLPASFKEMIDIHANNKILLNLYRDYEIKYGYAIFVENG